MPTVTLPTFHSDQVRVYNGLGKYTAVRCGRRWGKTWLGQTIACDLATKGFPVGFFAPDYKILSETYHEILDILRPIKRSASRMDGVIRTTSGGRIDFWTLENDRAGRSRKYKKVIIDEGAFGKENVLDIWRKSIRPTLIDLSGSALVLSNTNGVDPTNFMWRICNEPEHGFTQQHAPTRANPYLPREEIEKLKAENHPLVYMQEYEAEFVDWAGVQFFSVEDLLYEGLPVAVPARCDSVFAVIDSAVKDGKEHDGTAVSYWATSMHFGYPLVCLDWDIVQMEGALLETWIPSVFIRLEELARETGARMGSLGAWIEDKASGTILLQQTKARYPVHAIDSKLTSLGKDARAINISGQIYQKKVKISKHAHEKVTVYKGQSRNHFLAQVLNYKVGDKLAYKRADDLFDTFCYAVAIALGNNEGY